MTNTPILGLTMMSASQAQKEVVFNNFLIAMDALFKGSVLDVSLTAPPGSPAAGDAYIVAASPTGAWSGKAGKVTFYYNGWQFVNPSLKMRLYSAAQDAFYVYQSDSTWHAEPASTVSVLGDLTDVSGTATDGYVLTYVAADSKWEPKAAVYTASLHSLTDVNVTEGAGIDGKALVWNNTAGKWAAASILSETPGFLGLSDVVTTGVSGGFVPVYGATVGPGGTPGVHFINPSSLITVSTLASVGDVSYPTGGAGAIPSGAYLQWNGAAWVPSTSAVSVSIESLSDGPGALTGNAHKIIRVDALETQWEYVTNTLSNLADVAVTESTDIDGYVLAWNYGEQRWVPVAHGTNSLVALTDVAVTENSGYDNTFLYWNNTSGKWAQKLLLWADIQGKPALFSGAYADLTGKPGLAAVATSGAYSDLTGKPTLFSGAYSDLTGKPILFSGAYADLTGAPSIPTNGSFNLASLGDVTMTTGSGVDGYVVYWNNGASKFELKAAGGGTLATLSDVNVTEGSGIDGYFLKWDNGTSKWIAAASSGGGSSTLAADTDVTLTSPSDGQVLTYHGATSKWINAAPSGGGGGGGGAYVPLVIVQSALQGNSSGGAITLGAAPTEGNTLVCLATSQAVMSPGTGWVTLQSNVSGLDWAAIYVKIAGSGESATQTPFTQGSSNTAQVCVYELSGADASKSLATALSNASNDQVTTTPVTANVLTDAGGCYLVFVSSTATGTPTLSAGTIDQHNTALTGGRNVVAGHLIDNNGGSRSFTTTFGGSGTAKALVVAMQPASAIGTLTLASSLSDVVETSPTDGQVLTYDAGSSKWINATPSGGGGGGGGSNSPPIATALTAYTNLGGSTLTQRTSGAIPSLSIVAAGSDGNIYAAMEAAPAGTFSLVAKAKVAGTTNANNWHGAGLAVYNSGNSHFGSTMFNGANTFYPLGWTSTSGFTIHSTNNMQDADLYQHIDYDGTLLKYGVSRNGIDVYWIYTETMSSTIGAITHVGIAWYGNGDYPYEFEHYHSGALGTSGLTAGGGGGGGGSGTLAGDTDVSISGPANNQALLYDTGTSLWKNVNSPYNVAAFIGGVMDNGETLVAHVPPVAVEIDASDCQAKAGTAATGSTTVNINKNGTTVGTITWSSSGTTGTVAFTGSTSLAAGDVLALVAPGTADVTLADVAITIAGHRT